MAPDERFAAAAAAFVAALDAAPARPLGERVETLATALADLYAAGRRLPATAPTAPPPADDGAPVDLGRFEDGRVAERLRAVARWVRDPARAAGGWPRWSADALAALVVLHAAAEAFRDRPTARARRAPPDLVPLAKPERGQVGLRFEPLGIGVLVREVAPGGAADGLVRPGDVLLSSDGRALDALDAGAVAELLVGAPGEARRVEVYRDGATHEVVIVAR